ncbi:urease accessory protein [Dioscorea alata]|uniref:Urease accessory protein n=1 Tax=Dioscorea alata TaxID=55571 RepID=A0ACB7U2V4_DIOAL|nr:urease accessory protein [Dioscorea alata]
MEERMAETGYIAVERVEGRSTVTRCFCKYPLKLIVPKKVGPSATDAVWIYSISYGGGIVSGDRVSCGLSVADDCTVALTTQASTKVYKSVDSKCSEQALEARVGRNAFLAVIPDPVTCFSTARYSQKQVFYVYPDSNLVVVDWITSGRHESGERWNFELYKSTNHIFGEGHQPLFIDSILLEERSGTSISKNMQGYQVIAMIIIMGPKLKHVQNQVLDEVKRMMSGHFRTPGPATGRSGSKHDLKKPELVASCSTFGPKMQAGVVVRVAAMTTESVYMFLRHHLASLEPLLGVSPYR